MITPIMAMTLIGVPLSTSPITTPTNANGIAIIMTNGYVSDSNCAAITMNTSKTIRSKSVNKSEYISF